VVPYFSLPHFIQQTLLIICPSVLQVSNKEHNIHNYEHKEHEMANSITKKATKRERGRRRRRKGEVEGKGE
jgi:hypothetical protein